MRRYDIEPLSFRAFWRLMPVLVAALAGRSARAQAVVECDDDRYQASVVGCQASVDRQGHHDLWITLRFTNRSDTPLVLAGGLDKLKATDEQGMKYYGAFSGAVGNVYSGASIARFILPPHRTADALLKLYTLDSPKTGVGKSFRVEFPMSDVEAGTVRHAPVGPTRLFSLSNLTAEPPSASVAETRVVAGPFAAKVTSATVAPSATGSGEAVALTVEVTNLTKAPLPLAYTNSSGVDDHGHALEEGGLKGGRCWLIGIPYTSEYDVSPKFTLAPGERRSFTFALKNEGGRIAMDEPCAAYVGICTLAKGTDGKYHADQGYSLSFLSVRPTAHSSEPIISPNDP